uniref:Toll-like recptor 10 n=1 Tax=Oncomelania hupensis TaxID=56141 RepID=A0A2H4HHX1_9CAEN|nr:toll-like recptor 10 [Oncomelania hupensis]
MADLPGTARAFLILGILVLSTSSSAASFDWHVRRGHHNMLPKNLNKDRSLSSTPSAGNNGSFCFEDKCRCTSKQADCSRNNGTLTFIPTFKPNYTTPRISELDFSFNDLLSIPDAEFMKNATNMTSLNLSHNKLAYIAPGAFSSLKKLTKLILDNNHLRYQDVAAIFPAPRLNKLQLISAGLGPGPIPDNLFKKDSAPRLFQLRLDNNRLISLNMSTLTPLKRLEILTADNCGLYDSTVTSVAMPKLVKLSLKSNAMYDLPQTCDSHNGVSLFPRLRKLLFGGTMLKSLPGKYCLPALTMLDLSDTRINRFTTDMFNHGKFPRLTRLSLFNNRRIQQIEAFAFRHPKLKFIALMYSYLSLKNVHDLAFASCPLIYLQVSHSRLGSDSPEKFSKIMASVPKLQVLMIGSSEIRIITKDMFNHMPKLRRLHLYQNMLTELPDGVFDQLTNLTELDLSDNELTTIGPSTFNPQTQSGLQKLDLSGNKFRCDCSILWFKEWYLSHSELFEPGYDGYFCDNDPRYPLSKLMLREQVCYFSQFTYKIIISVISMFFIVFTSATAILPYRWHIRLLMYEAFRGSGDARYKRLREGRFDYDVFVSYAHEDLPWIQQQLLSHLESGLNLKLCIHQRDFMVGENIVDNIVHCVQSSKKVLMVFSRAFVASQWCQFELNYCLRHVMDYDDALIVTCIDDMTSLKATSAMMAVLKITTYIQWDCSPQAAASFWGRIQLALGDILNDDVSG